MKKRGVSLTKAAHDKLFELFASNVTAEDLQNIQNRLMAQMNPAEASRKRSAEPAKTESESDNKQRKKQKKVVR